MQSFNFFVGKNKPTRVWLIHDGYGRSRYPKYTLHGHPPENSRSPGRRGGISPNWKAAEPSAGEKLQIEAEYQRAAEKNPGGPTDRDKKNASRHGS